MTTRLNPYLSFRDCAREAMELYRSVFGGEVTFSTFAEFGASEDPAESDKIMHAMLTTPGGMVLMASDTPNSLEVPSGSSISLSITGGDEVELRGYWERLADGGEVVMPLEAAPWGDTFGMLTDRFGTAWMISIAGRGSPDHRDVPTG
ncbi:VOC family protein [Cellulomonas carbonis]|uniref:3-demethylubiquinone-9 3-methyltransferase n=1 Tax=Cellulomonas carbonis T26 TaxID=947969 RepID=A0A0A0BLE8_9CELL|nr:VOC family protein [Cellulomonas carbonis]KGM08761.1 3-demethylubiquinone-9 3-methyltransferase [Cellulomonas carbonis T26]GGB99356.1 VOC family protein [Cellulomonas carbonis]